MQRVERKGAYLLLLPFDGFRKPREDYNVPPKHGRSWVNFAKAKKPTHECYSKHHEFGTKN